MTAGLPCDVHSSCGGLGYLFIFNFDKAITRTNPFGMNNRNLFILLVIICVLAPGIHYFIAGRDMDNTGTRNMMVGAQVLGGFLLLFLFGRSKAGQKS
jgi:hypothetical protein